MYGLTFHRPWGTAVVLGAKPIENRPWPPPAPLLGERVFAVHAGLTWDEKGFEYIRERLRGDTLRAFEKRLGFANIGDRGAILGVVSVTGYVGPGSPQPDLHPGLRVVGEGEDPASLSEDERRWYFGPYGWRLANAIALPRPIPCRGFQRLWRLPGPIQQKLDDQLGRLAAGLGVS